jgi:NAD(P)-dependent dehydrogenase (short-subunit alcohol dehydrogenase family)
MGDQNYNDSDAYAQSKLANLLFTFELQRRLEQAGKRNLVLAAHPGYTATNLQAVGPKLSGSAVRGFLMGIANRLFAQDVEIGALPSLYAATAQDVNPCDYIGPDGFNETRGYPQKVSSSEASHNRQDAQKLWEVSEKLTGVSYSLH